MMHEVGPEIFTPCPRTVVPVSIIAVRQTNKNLDAVVSLLLVNNMLLIRLKIRPIPITQCKKLPPKM